MKREEIDLLLARSQRLIEQGLAVLEKSKGIAAYSREVAAKAVAVKAQCFTASKKHQTNGKPVQSFLIGE